MATYEDHIETLEGVSGIPSETLDAAADAISFVACLHNLYVDSGVLNDDATVDVSVLETLVDAYHGELAAAAILLSEDSFKAIPELLRTTATSMVDSDDVVPVTVRKGFSRLATRIEQTRKQRDAAFAALQLTTSESLQP